jgi:diguanylate cyclase (GGDEF)-like protein
VLLAAVLALVPLILATLAFGHAFRASETGRVDARVAAAARDAFDSIVAADTAASTAARRLASSLDVQRALARRDARALDAFGYRKGALVVRVSELDGTPATASAGTLVRTVSVVSSGRTIGRVDATVVTSRLFAPLSAQTHSTVVLATGGVVRSGPLRGWMVRGPRGETHEVRFSGRGFRLLHEPVGPGVDLVVAVPDSGIASTVRRRQLVTLGAAALTVAALALAAFLLIQRRRAGAAGLRERGGHRSPVTLVGEVVAVAHDPRALLPVILETAVAAMDAAGGRVVWDGDQIASIGSATGSVRERLVFSLDEEDEHGSARRQLVLYPRRGGFTDADREVADALVAQGRIALENARLQSVVRRQAVTDELTDLANRRRFMEVLQQEVARAARFDSALALALCDLDHFKQINDRYGHQVGDDVLRAAANVIRDRVRETDLPARIGGEEFGIILSGTDLDGACALAEQLRHDLSEQVDVASTDWAVTASFGVAMLHQGESAELLIGAADRALYRAKAEGRNRVCPAEEKPSAAA